MKSVKFAKRFREPLSATTYQEWPAGTEDVVSDAVAKRAAAAGVLDGEPVDAPEGKVQRKSKAKG